MRFAGALTGLVSGGTVAVILGSALLNRAEGFSYARAFVPLVLLALFGLIYDLLRLRLPRIWRSGHPGRLWMSWLFKTTLYWTAVFPIIRLVQDLATYREMGRYASDESAADLFPYLGSAGGLLGFLIFQAICGSALGIVFTILYRRLGGRA